VRYCLLLCLSISLVLAPLACLIPSDGSLEIVRGTMPLLPLERVQFSMIYKGNSYDGCGLHWYVNGKRGGDATIGFISTCGEYTAPQVEPDCEVEITAYKELKEQCTNDCPRASGDISFYEREL